MHPADDTAPGPGATNRADHLIAGILGLVLAAWLLPFAAIGIDPHHDGIMLKPALDVLAGQTLFRDTFMQYGALSCYFQVAALKVAPTLLCLKYMTVACYAATLAMLYLTWRLFLPRLLALLACAIFALFLPAYELNWNRDPWILLPWSSVLALFFQTLAMHGVLKVIRHEEPVAWSMIIGLASGVALWCRQPVGVVLIGQLVVVAIALPLTGWKPARHSLRAVLGPACWSLVAINAILLAAIVWSGALEPWWYQNFTWPRKWAETGGGGSWGFFQMLLHPERAVALAGLIAAWILPGLVSHAGWTFPRAARIAYYALLAAACAWQFAQVLTCLAYRDGGWALLLPALVAGQALISIAQAVAPRWFSRPADFHLVATFAALSVGSLSQYFPVPDDWHVFWALGPAFGLCVYTLWRWSGATAPVVAAVVTVALAPAVADKVRATQAALTRPLVTLAAPASLRGMRVSPAEAASWAALTHVVESAMRVRPDVPAVAIGYDALYLCLVANRTNPSPYFITWHGLLDAENTRQRWDFVARERPVMFLQKADWTAVNDFYRRARYVPLLYLPDILLEVAVPQEMADALGMKAYDASPPAAPAPASSKP